MEGVTSARMAIVGLSADSATVVGQPLAGVALWRLRCPGRELPLVVVPGNVGGDETLAQLLGMLDRGAAASAPSGGTDS